MQSAMRERCSPQTAPHPATGDQDACYVVDAFENNHPPPAKLFGNLQSFSK